jgi:hypothetical protein
MAYPTEPDAIETTPAGSAALGDANPTHVEHHQQLHAAIDSIRDVLGDDPDIGFTTVEAAITAVRTSITIDEQTDSFTIAASQAGKRMKCNKVTTLTVTVPPNASVPIATEQAFEFVQWGAGTVTFAEGAGVEIRSAGDLLSIDGQYASATLQKVDTNEWLLTGALA